MKAFVAVCALVTIAAAKHEEKSTARDKRSFIESGWGGLGGYSEGYSGGYIGGYNGGYLESYGGGIASAPATAVVAEKKVVSVPKVVVVPQVVSVRKVVAVPQVVTVKKVVPTYTSGIVGGYSGGYSGGYGGDYASGWW